MAFGTIAEVIPEANGRSPGGTGPPATRSMEVSHDGTTVQMCARAIASPLRRVPAPWPKRILTRRAGAGANAEAKERAAGRADGVESAVISMPRCTATA